MHGLRLRKIISPVDYPNFRASALWEIQGMPRLMVRKIDYLTGWQKVGWSLQYLPYDREEHQWDERDAQVYEIWQFLKERSFATRSDLLLAVRSAQTYLRAKPAAAPALPF